MRPIALVVGLLVLPALLLAWIGLRPSGESGVGAGAGSRTTLAGGSRAASDSKPGDLDRTAAAQEPLASQRSAQAPGPGPLSTAAAQPSGGEAAGTLRLRGTVLDEAGRPVAQARVLVAPGGEGWFIGPLDSESNARFGGKPPSEATTDQQGAFEFTNVSGGDLRLAVRKSGFAPYDASNLAVPSDAEHELEPIRLAASVFLSGRVVDHAGRPVPSARILRSSSASSNVVFLDDFAAPQGSLAATSAPDGSFEIDQLAAGPYRLRVVSDDHPTLLHNGVTQRPGERIAGLTLQLEEGRSLEGRVEGVPSGSLTGLQVRARPVNKDGVATDGEGLGFALDPQRGETRRADVAADGGFRLGGLRAGRKYQLSLRRAGTQAEFDPMGRSLALPLTAFAGERGVVLRWQADGVLTLQVIDAKTRKPVTLLAARASFPGPFEADFFDEQAKPHAEGKVRLENLRPKQPEERARLQLKAPGYHPYTQDQIAVVAGQELDLGTIALEPAPALRIEVVDARSQVGVAKAQVQLRKSKGPQSALLHEQSIEVSMDDGEIVVAGSAFGARTDEQGRAILNAFTEDPSVLSVSHGDFAPSQVELPPVGPDGRDVRIELTQGGGVRIRARTASGDPAAAVKIEHRPPFGPSAEFAAALHPGAQGGGRVTDSKGELTFSRLAAGTHRFRVAGPQSGGLLAAGEDGDALFAARLSLDGDQHGGAMPWSEVQVDPGAEVLLELRAPLLLGVAGTIREGGAALPGASLSVRRATSGATDPGQEFFAPPAVQGRTDGNGQYTLEGLSDGEWELTVRHKTRAMPTRHLFAIVSTDARVDLDLDVTVIEGRILDPAGKPVAGARVRAAQASQADGGNQMSMVFSMDSAGDGGMEVFQLPGSSDGRATSDAQGRYQLRGVASGVELEIRADAKGRQSARSKSFEVAPGQTKTGVDLELPEAGKIAVKVLASDGSPAKFAFVKANWVPPAGKSEEQSQEAPPQASGMAQGGQTTLDGLKPGRWKVEIQPLSVGTGGEDQPSAPEPQEAEVEAGKTAQLTFQLT
jgi:protocatechuate 3,4-dioxygenase beta subunit